MQEKKKSEKSNDTLSVILEQGIVKMYHALDITGYMANYFERKQSPECWILFSECSQCEDVGVTEIDILGEKFTVPKKMDLQDIHCILYRVGEYYRFEKVYYDTKVNKLDLESLLMKVEHFKENDTVSFNSRCLSGHKYRNLYANHNGFFVEGLDYGKEVLPWELETKVCYRPNTKVINERVIDRITYRIDSNDQEKDMEGYTNYFLTTLADGYMKLREDDSLMLYMFLAGNACSFKIDAKEYYLRKDKNKEKYIFFKVRENGSMEFYENKFATNLDVFKYWSDETALKNYLNKWMVLDKREIIPSDRENGYDKQLKLEKRLQEKYKN